MHGLLQPAYARGFFRAEKIDAIRDVDHNSMDAGGLKSMGMGPWNFSNRQR